ncbi:putative endo-1 [Lasiodiplodia hormozganensis]|uniref:endo-1,3(4)-beta-glucanase n=2 Tax=Lasiodiplodia TaxID=66739 RepID=A0A5N5DFV8_9PEZI|nr:putative endo-1,3(4)-beta-glucanase [Lasiodiplodia theobromae]KAK0650990.1 putative endo-1 [Lasiodiplodia hormozganensis]
MFRYAVPSLLLATGVTALPAVQDDDSLNYSNTTAGWTPVNVTTDYLDLQVGGDSSVSTASVDAAAAYDLVASYTSSNWFDSFAVQALGTNDPTGGYVNYLSQADAQSRGLYQIRGNQVYIGVDSTTVLDPSGSGRPSVRIQSNTAFTHGLFILDLAHMPGSICGSWPAYWMYGPNWPNSGEIDMIEGVNNQQVNQMTLHTAAGCTVTVGEGGQSGTSGNTNCNANTAYDGCGVTSNTANSYGTGFNNAGGGVYATFWNQGSIQVWYFPRSSIPSDISSGGTPNPSNWGQPMTHFAGCSFDNFIQNNNIVFDVTFCGQWAGNVWSSGTCASQTGNGNCINYVANNPGVFSESYWLINSLKVYTVPT